MNFSMRRLTAVAAKEFLHIIRDWRSLFLAIAIPIMLLLLFGYALNMDIKNIPTAVIDRSDTPQSRELISMFDGSPYFQIKGYYNSYEKLYQDMRKRKILTAVIIGKDYAEKLHRGEKTAVQIVVDGSDANTGRLAMNYASAIGLIVNMNIIAESKVLAFDPVSLEVVPRAWYNQGLVSTYMIVPGIIAIVTVVISAMLASVIVAREWEMGTMEQLISTPIRRIEFTFGKIFPLFVVGLLDVGISSVLGKLIFNVPLRGNPGLIFFIASIFLIGVLFYGLMLSISLKTQVLANQIALLSSFLPTMMLSGFVFTIDNMPIAVRALTYIFPARYFISILKGIYLKGIGLEMMMFSFVLLAVYSIIMIFAANKRLKMSLE